MRFNVKAMIAAIDTQVAADLARWHERHAQLEDERASERCDWREQYGDAWKNSMRKALAKLRKGVPLVREDFPHNSNRYLAVYTSQVRDQMPFKADPDLLGLQVVLGTLADEEVTSSGLRELGVTSATLRRVVLAMNPKSITSR